MKTDAGTLSPETQAHLRKQAIRWRKQGMSYVAIAEQLEVHRNTVSNCWKAYQAEGVRGIRSQPRGRKPGEQRTLSPGQEQQIQDLICDQTPDQYKLSFALWTRQAAQALIRQRLNRTVPLRTVGETLKRWGFTPQKPLKRAYEQRPAQVKKWLDETYPAIAARAKREKAEIQWGDETGLRSDSQYGRSYAPKGKTPVIRRSAKRVSMTMISTVSNQGKVRFMIYSGGMNAKRLIQFLKSLIRTSEHKIFWILDNLRAHHARPVKAWLAEAHNTARIEVFFLPAYSPELNPDEYLNGDLKAGMHSKPPARDTSQLEKKVCSHMKTFQKSPARAQKYFKHPRIAYAA